MCFICSVIARPDDFVTNSHGESWTHLLKNHESQSRTMESQLKKKTMSPWVLCNHTVNLKTDSKTLYYNFTESILLLL